MADEGTNNSDSVGGDWFIVSEADCEDEEPLSDLERIFDESSESEGDIEFIDDADHVDEGNSAALHNAIMLEQTNKQVQDLKRKYYPPSPKAIKDLSPRLAAVSISSVHKSSKRKLFRDGVESKNEASSSSESLSPEVVGTKTVDRCNLSEQLLKSQNRKATALAVFKHCFGVSFTDLTRVFQSDKTMSQNWVLAVFGPLEDIIESAKTILLKQCLYLQQSLLYSEKGPISLWLLEFVHPKCRLTVNKLFCTLLNCDVHQILSEPPRCRSSLTGLYFWKKSVGGGSYVHGNMPDWLVKLTSISHESATEAFQLATMIQWAYDNNFTNEAEIAYRYAELADEDANAAAWLKTNNQAKFVKDCCAMVRHYKNHELKSLTMSEFISLRCSKTEETGDWKKILKLLKYQGINGITFLTALLDFLSGRPKSHCIVIYGPPDTGKSYFCFSLVSFLQGKVISFANAKSHFWLQPLSNAKIGLLDDATEQCWTYIDTHLRTALDGNPVSVDCKYKMPTQMTLPPLLVTTNVDLPNVEKYKYLKSRTKCFKFANPCLFDDSGNPIFDLTDGSWKGFFQHLSSQLGLQISTDEDGEIGHGFRCMPRETAGAD
ncbi:E1 [Tick-associated papillomavirus lsx]|nr:E1 [Tick-associated papillomavirus lsx]